MGAAMREVTNVQRYAYKVPVPTAYVEVAKAFRWAAKDFQKVHGKPAVHDDDLMVAVEDECITVYFEVIVKGDVDANT